MTDPLNNPPPAVIAFLNERGRSGPDGVVYFVDNDGVSPILDSHAPGVPNADARGVVRWLRTAKPELWDTAAIEPTKHETPPAPAVDWAKRSMTERMVAARQGDASAMASLGMKPSTHEGSTYTGVTDLMVRVRAGDASALDALNAQYLTRPTR